MPLSRDGSNGVDEEICEDLFVKHHYRTKDGRYVVPTPSRQENVKLRNFYHKAVQCYLGQEEKVVEN